MEIEQSTVTKLTISGAKALDPISVILDDLEPRKGKITITCYGKAWTAYWGGMGERTIAQFFYSCDQHYLAGNLSDIRSEIPDVDKINEDILKAEITVDSVDHIENPQNNHELMVEVYGPDWYCNLPEKPNPNYQYLCRIILAVQEALKIKVINNGK